MSSERHLSMDNADIWLRVSTEDQNPENQLAECKRFAEHRGWNVRKIWRTHFSGWKGEIPEKKELLNDVRLGKTKHVIVWALDRWTRKGAEDLMRDWKFLDSHGVSLHSVREEFLDFFNMAGIGEYLREFVLKILAWQANLESLKKSERVRAAYKRKKLRGELGNWGKHKIRVNVKKAVELRKSGMSFSKIAKELGISRSYAHKICNKFI